FGERGRFARPRKVRTMSAQIAASLRIEESEEMNPAEATVRFSDDERDSGVPSPENTARALELFHKYGFVRLENVFRQDFLDKLKAHYNVRYKRFLEGTY